MTKIQWTNLKVRAIWMWFTLVSYVNLLDVLYYKQALILQVGTFCLKGYTGNHSMELDRLPKVLI